MSSNKGKFVEISLEDFEAMAKMNHNKTEYIKKLEAALEAYKKQVDVVKRATPKSPEHLP